MVSVRHIVVLVALLGGCTSVSYTSSCNPGDSICQRNQDAQTLFIIGEDEAAVQMLCADPKLYEYLGSDRCDSPGHDSR